MEWCLVRESREVPNGYEGRKGCYSLRREYFIVGYTGERDKCSFGEGFEDERRTESFVAIGELTEETMRKVVEQVGPALEEAQVESQSV